MLQRPRAVAVEIVGIGTLVRGANTCTYASQRSKARGGRAATTKFGGTGVHVRGSTAKTELRRTAVGDTSTSTTTTRDAAAAAATANTSTSEAARQRHNADAQPVEMLLQILLLYQILLQTLLLLQILRR